ncbi:MAG: hypothetical protein A2057_12240 [Ignavibacteria bacterium GWA2_35_9]|nr:MAG: hypothetical protein A2057_12240 [Ignavibacteria bacterium GWA2_35_9]OGU44410.1 MAG: hypothetical protein A2000_05865 [Ignavibacteria bacterium GWB2_36_8]OGU52338.1 MAG: hypothetical protein A2080_09640 [Ignavibacteria bacterium GWC2_36_12]
MKLSIKNLLSCFLLFIPFFYSSEVSNLFENNLKEDCNSRKNCTCCEMNSDESSCCSNHVKGFTLNIDLPCNHPNFSQINIKTDFSIITLIPDNRSFISKLEYSVFASRLAYYVEQSGLIKPPNSFQ